MSAISDELLLQLMIEPAESAGDAMLVYADALSRRGDPRGELIVVQRALAAGEDSELRATEAALFSAHPELRAELDALFYPGSPAMIWRDGFVHRVRISNEWAADLTIDSELSIAETLERVLQHPSCALLRELELASYSTGDDFRASMEVLDRARPGALRRLCLNDRWLQDEPDRPRYHDNSWFRIGELDALTTATPEIETLELIAGDFDGLDGLVLPHLRSLSIRTGGLRPERLGGLLERAWPALERLELWFGQARYGGTCDVPDLARILDGARFPRLRWLGLMNAEFTDDVVEPLARSAILPQLAHVSFALGCRSRDGALRLVAHADAFRSVTLDVSLNLLDRESRNALRALGNVTVGAQRGEYFVRYAAVGE